MSTVPLGEALEELARLHGEPAPLPARTLFEWVLHENATYLGDDATRERAMTALGRRVGTRPSDLLAASPALLTLVAEEGGRAGLAPSERASRWTEAAALAMHQAGGDLDAEVDRLGAGSTAAARLLKKFPGIGGPGAEKLLLLTGRRAVLALESNGLRVLLRLGHGVEAKSYDRSYRSAQAAAIASLGERESAQAPRLLRAHRLLRRHGQEVCRRSQPLCPACPLQPRCPHARARGG
jgi:endonuclease III